MTCKRCGCTETTPCIREGQPCAWMLSDLCTACLTPEEAAIDQAYGGILESLRGEQLYQRCAVAVAQGLAANPDIDTHHPKTFAALVCDLALALSEEIALGVPEVDDEAQPSGLMLP